MAIIKTGYLSPFKNKLGNGVGRRWRNLNVVAEYNGTPRNPRTTAQQTQRARFAQMSELSRSFKSTLVDGLGGVCAGTKTFPRAKFIELNKGAVSATNPQTVTVTYDELIIARGSVVPPSFQNLAFDAPMQVDCDFGTAAFHAECPLADVENLMVRLVVYCQEAKLALFSDTKASEGSISMHVPDYWNGLKVYVYGYLRWEGDDMPEYGLNKGDVSDSIYIGFGNIG